MMLKLTSIRMKPIPLFMVFIALAGCSEDSNDPFVITTETEYAVYRALIEEMYVLDWVKLIVIRNETVIDSQYYAGAFGVPDELSLSPEILNSIENQNRQPQAISCDKLALSVACEILDQEAFDQVFTRDDEHPKDIWDNWDRFYEKYPDSQGIMRLSRVGFNTDGSEALVYVGNTQHDLVGAGYYVLLVKKAGTWVVHSKELTWIS